MAIEIAGTTRLLKEFSTARESLPAPSNGGLDLWYGDLIYHDRRKCVILRNPATGVLCFYLFKNRKEIREILQRWPDDLERILTTLLPGVEGSVLAAALSKEQCQLRRTTDRGSLSSLVNKRELLLWELDDCDPDEAEEEAMRLTIKCAKGPLGPKYSFPYDNLVKLAQAKLLQ